MYIEIRSLPFHCVGAAKNDLLYYKKVMPQ